jgi:signal transduction histidine kinase
MVDFTSDAQHSNTRNLLAAIYAPVLSNGRVIGLLGAERHRPPGKAIAYFPHWSVDLLTALARVASMSLEKADLLSSLKGVQNALERSQAQLKQKDEFLLLTAHELKNPLTAIRGQAQILQRRLKKLMQAQTGTLQQTNDLMSGAESIEHQTYRIAHMINTLLEVSRADLGRVNISLQDIDLVQLARRTLKEHIPLAPGHDLRLVVNREPQPILAENTTSTSSIIIQGDELRLEQVLSNLVGNAIKYSPDGGPITLSVRTDGEYVELSVEDQGIGIPIKEQARLTERFYRAENAVESNTQGLGLGLYLVHSLVTMHGGHMTIKSEGVPGKGSAFTIELPTKAQ